MDTLSIGPGSTVVVPVNVSGALLALGDVPAAMGEGEVIGIALEGGAELSISAEVRPQVAPPCPMVETERHIVVIVTEEGFEVAAERAVRVMRELLAARLGVSLEEAYALVGMSGDLRIPQNVNPYGASKSGLLGVTRALATEWAQHHIRVNAIAPGYFRTAMTEVFYENDGWQARMLDKIPQRRFGKDSDIGGVAVFLCSDAAAYITGHCIPVDGGYLASI